MLGIDQKRVISTYLLFNLQTILMGWCFHCLMIVNLGFLMQWDQIHLMNWRQLQRYAWRAWHCQIQESVYDQRLKQTYRWIHHHAVCPLIHPLAVVRLWFEWWLRIHRRSHLQRSLLRSRESQLQVFFGLLDIWAHQKTSWSLYRS